MRIGMRSIIIAFGVLCISLGHAQLIIDTTRTPEYLIDNMLVGQGLRVGNIRLTGARAGLGKFQCAQNVIGMTKGILVATGLATNAIGPNDKPNTSDTLSLYGLQHRETRVQDLDLNKLSKGKTFDVNILEFDFIPFHNRLTFNYSFGSEEYKEYVGSPYNDVFAFMIDGPGVSKKNLAVVPGSGLPVTVNSVNHRINSSLFLNNDFFIRDSITRVLPVESDAGFFKKLWYKINDVGRPVEMVQLPLESERRRLDADLVNYFQYDGFTKVFEAASFVTPYQIYHLKIAIGDVGDAIYDSGVFLEAHSLSSIRDTSQEGFVEYRDSSRLVDCEELFDTKWARDSVVIEEKRRFETTSLFFKVASYFISVEGRERLVDIAEYLSVRKDLQCILRGYTDSRGSKKYNEELAEKRAFEVIGFLKNQGISPSRLTYEGSSQNEVIGDESTEKGRAMNRRVELTIVFSE